MRHLNAQDAKAMASIHAQSFPRGWDALDMATHTQKDLCLGIDVAGELAAFTLVSVSADQADILTFATDPTHRRQGLGRRLLDGLLTELERTSAREAFLDVAEDNAAAIALYKQAGFEPIGRRPAYYRRDNGRIAALTFRKKLDGAARGA